MITSKHTSLYSKYIKFKKRLARHLKSGTYDQFTDKKQRQIQRRLERYQKRLLRTAPQLASMAVGTALVVPAFAQNFQLVTTTASPFIPLNVDSDAPFGLTDVGLFASPTFVDIDNDGDLDAFIGKLFGQISYFENTSSNSSIPAFELVNNNEPFGLSDEGDFSSPTFVDIDNDGDADAFVGVTSGALAFFRNTSTNSSIPAFELSNSSEPFGIQSPGAAAVPSFVDIDGDDDLDLFVGSLDGTIYFYRNTSTDSTIPAFSLATDDTPFGLTNVGANSAPALVDIDNDGDLDAFIGESNGTINYFENTSSNSSIPAFRLSDSLAPFGLTDVGYSSKPTFTDIDSDGDLDVFIGIQSGKTVYFENVSTDSSIPNFLPAATDVGQDSKPTFTDIDGDGDLDAFVGERNGNINFFENTSTHSSIPAFRLSSSSEPFGLTDIGTRSAPAFADLDGDGDLDAFIGEDSGTTIYFENTSTDSSMPAFTRSTSSAPFGIGQVDRYATPTFVDIDGDGDIDTFVGEEAGRINFVGNTSADTSTSPNQPNPFGSTDVGQSSTPTFGDIDGDGTLDALVGERDGNINYFENTSTNPPLADFTLVSTDDAFGLSDIGGRSSPVLVDIDGDGDLDVFVGEYEGGIAFFENIFINQPSLEVSDVTMTITAACPDNTNDFATITLESNNAENICDDNGNATYTVSVSPSGQGVTANVIGTGAGDCEFGIEISSDATATPDEYSINLVIEDEDGVSNSSGVSSTSNEAGTLLFLNLGMYEVLGCSVIVDEITINDAEADKGETTTFLTVTLDPSGCDANGDAIYSVDVTPNNQGVNANIVGTGTDDCEFTIEVSADFTATTDDYDINLIIEDMDGVTNNSMVGTIVGSTNTFVIFEPQSFEVTDQVLPVELLYFKAQATKANQAQLTWTTASETDNSHFVIERSQDGKSFEAIGKVEGAGTTLERQDYHFVDESPETGINYYRLQQIDYDGAFEYSQIEAINIIGEAAVLSIFPIPASTQLNYKVDQLANISAIYLFDVLGRLVKTERELDGVIDISDLPSGQYTLVLEGKGQRVHRLVQKL